MNPDTTVLNDSPVRFRLQPLSLKQGESDKNRTRRHPFDCRPFEKSEVNEARYWAKIDKNGPTPIEFPELGSCWLWTAAKNKRGYGSFSVNGRLILAHRVAVVMAGRELPTNRLGDHVCHNRSCVNPAHIAVATILENNRNNFKVQSNYCLRGHEFTPANTFIKHGSRQCRQCQHIHGQKWRDKQKALRPANRHSAGGRP